MREIQPVGRRMLPVTIVLAFIGLVSLSASGVGQESGAARPGGATPTGVGVVAGELPLRAVQLFSTGVGYFQHDGFVEGDAAVELTFSTDDINDVLKSLVLQDFDGGSVRASYPSQDPLSRILQSFSINLADNPPFAELLTRARGEQIEVSVASAGPSRLIIGTLTGVEYHHVTRPEGSERVAYLTLLTTTGFRRVALPDVETLRFLRRSLQEEFDAALAVIAANRQENRKTVTVHFTGSGRRRVRIGYVRAVPVWKTSYRIVLGSDDRAQLQGWALVENTGETDWSDVSLSLVSTQPISFIMDLYTPVYTSRPRISLDIGPTVAPQAYDRAIAPSVARSAAPSAPMAESAAGLSLRDEFRSMPGEPEPIDLSQGVSSGAIAEPGAVYRIATPVSIPRRGAAMIPIVATSLPAERLAVFDRNVLSTRALGGVRLDNETGLQLPAGPVTVFDGASYAGDAQFPRMVAGETRLLTYAVELGTAVLVRADTTPQEITSIRVSSGTLRIQSESRLTTEYVLSRTAEESLLHVLVHPKRGDWSILRAGVSNGPAVTPVGETPTAYRYEVVVSPDVDTTFEVREQQVRAQAVAVSSIRDDQIVFYLSHGAIDTETANVLRRVQQLRARVAETEARRREVEQAVATIHREQERLRANLEVLAAGSDLARRYIATLTAQEDQLERLATDLTRAREDERRAREGLTAYIEGL